MQIRQSLLASSMAAMMAATSIASAEEVSCANPMSAEEQQAHIQNMQNMSEQDREIYRDRQYEILRVKVRELGCPELPETPPWKTVAKTAPPAPAAQQPPSAADQEAMIEKRRAETEKAMETRRAEIQKQMEARQAETEQRMQQREPAAATKQTPPAADTAKQQEEIAARQAAMQKQMEERQAEMAKRAEERKAMMQKQMEDLNREVLL